MQMNRVNVAALSFLGTAFLAAACAPVSKNESSRLERAPVTLVSQSQSTNADGSIELAVEERLGDAGRSERVAFWLPRDLRLTPAMDSEDLGVTLEYSAYVQDGVSKHGRRNYSDGVLPVLLRFRPFCLVRFRPFVTEEQHLLARAKMTTPVLSERLKNTDLSRMITRGEKLIFAVDRASERYDAKTKLTSIMLYPVEQDARAPHYISRMKCVGTENSVQILRDSFGVRTVYGMDLAQ